MEGVQIKMEPGVVTTIKDKEGVEDTKKVQNQNQQLNLTPVSVPNFNIVIVPPQNQVIDAKGNKYVFLDSSGNPLSPVLQIPIIGQIPIVQTTPEGGVQLLMVNPTLAPSSTPNLGVASEGKKTVIKSKNSVQLPNIDSAEEVIYVNPRQYNRIMIRRKQRFRLQEQGKIPSSGERKKYLHESRHLHAKNRCRESRGRFGSSPTQEVKGKEK